MWIEEDIGTKVNYERAREAIDTGSTRFATACPFCYIMLDDGVKGAGKDESEIKVGDIAIHLLDAIENGERSIANQNAPLATANVASSTTSFS
ncbi:MAG: hypothetical protein ACKOEF_01050 [Acidimicrobiaceae bacterium]